MAATSPTLAEAQEMYRLYIAAEKAVLKNQAYTIRDRTYTRANLEQIAKERSKWGAIVKKLSRGGARVRRVLPIDL